jgi:hypothetical protein
MKTEVTRLTCPDCGGSLVRVEEPGAMTEYRCRIGHIYSPKSALVVHAEREENTLWLAAVLLEEGAELAEEISNQASVNNPEQLKLVSAAKRNLAERLKRVVSDFVEIPMHLNQS